MNQKSSTNLKDPRFRISAIFILGLLVLLSGCGLQILQPDNDETKMPGEAWHFEADYNAPGDVHWGLQEVAFATSPDLSNSTDFVVFAAGQASVTYTFEQRGWFAIIAVGGGVNDLALRDDRHQIIFINVGGCTIQTVIDDCPPHLGCIDGVCAPCESADHCPNNLICTGGLCLPCQKAEECDEGQACLRGICQAECNPRAIFFPAEAGATGCREGEACIFCVGRADGYDVADPRCGSLGDESQYVCLQCDEMINNECEYGMVCDRVYGCRGCERNTECDDDLVCHETGRCGDPCTPGSCSDGLICDIYTQSTEKSCGYCRSDYDCFYELGEGYLCHEGHCTTNPGVCDLDNPSSCINRGWWDVPICGSDRNCRACLNDEECQVALRNHEAYCDGYCHPMPDEF